MKMLEYAVEAKYYLALAVVDQMTSSAAQEEHDSPPSDAYQRNMKLANLYAFRCGWEAALYGVCSHIPTLLADDVQLATAFIAARTECSNEDRVVAWDAPVDRSINSLHHVFVVRRLTGCYDVVWTSRRGSQQDDVVSNLPRIEDAIAEAKNAISNYQTCAAEEMACAYQVLAEQQQAYECAGL